MKAKNIPDKVIMKSHCDQVISLMNEMKAYLELNEGSMNIQSNVLRELSGISICENSLSELKLFLGQIQRKIGENRCEIKTISNNGYR